MRRITSLLLLAIFVLLAITGLTMVFSDHKPRRHREPVAVSASPDSRSADARPERRSKSIFPKELHEWAGFAILVVIPLHLIYNYRLLLAHIGPRKRE